MGLLSIFFDNTYILHSVLQNRTLSFLPKIQIIIFQNVLTYEISTRYKPTVRSIKPTPVIIKSNPPSPIIFFEITRTGF